MIFKNITNNRIDAYGYTWQPTGNDGDCLEVIDETMIMKFRRYSALQELGSSVKNSDVPRETLKSQAIAAGLKVDGRWSETRLRKEMDNYMRGVNGN